MMSKEYCVYKHTTPSGKIYIGLTKLNPLKRWKNGKGYVLCTAFNRAIKKYGWDNIQHSIIAENLTEKEACELEQKLIKEYKSADPKFGYNMTHGGEHYIPNDEWRKRASEAHKKLYAERPDLREQISRNQIGKRATAATKEKMRISRLKYIAEHPEVREKCGATFRGKKRSAENCEKLRLANYKAIKCIETNEVFKSVMDAAKFASVCKTSISNHLAGRSKKCGGYTFAYAEKGD